MDKKKVRTFLEKIVVDAGVGRLSQTPNFEEKALVQVSRDLALMTGQKPQVRRVKKSIAGFKMREGQIVGLRVTLRRDKMVDFFERLISIVLPRVRDFSGLDPKSIDEGGVLNIGIREQAVFPEVTPEESPVSFSLGIADRCRGTEAHAAETVVRAFGVPLEKAPAQQQIKTPWQKNPSLRAAKRNRSSAPASCGAVSAAAASAAICAISASAGSVSARWPRTRKSPG